MDLLDFVTFPKYLFMIVFVSLGMGDLVAFLIIPCEMIILVVLSLSLLNLFLVLSMIDWVHRKAFYIVLFLWICNIAVFSYFFNTDECLRNEYFLEVLYVLQVLWSCGFLLYLLLLSCIASCTEPPSYIQV